MKAHIFLASGPKGPWALHTLSPGLSDKGTQELCWRPQLCLFNRSATDPVGHEVIWALGAGCREIVSLQVAPLHPW